MVTLHHRPHRLLLDTDQSRASPANNEANLDANMVIILAVLLCALGLNLIIRCALRCGRRFAFGTPDEAENARLAATTGLKKSALWWIPVAPYRPGLNIPATDCPICLGEFVDGEKVRVLPNCNHGFHVRCIDIWLVSHLSCPTCRHSLLDNPTGSDVVDDGILQNHWNAPGGGGGGGGSGQGDVQVVGVDE